MFELWEFDEVSMAAGLSIEFASHSHVFPKTRKPRLTILSRVSSRHEVGCKGGQMLNVIQRPLVAALVFLAGAGTAAGDTCAPVMEWNQYALSATVTASQGALVQIR